MKKVFLFGTRNDIIMTKIFKKRVVQLLNKRRLVMILVVVIGVPLFIWIQFFEVPNKVKIGEAKIQQDPTTHKFEEVTSFEDPYMGDNSNMINLFQSLPLNDHKGTLEMDSDMFSLIVHYNTTAAELGRKAEQAVIYNTTAAFTLIGNLQIVEMRFEDKSYTVTRENVEQWFGTTLVDFKDPEEFKGKVQEKLEKEDIDNWIMAYTEGE